MSSQSILLTSIVVLGILSAPIAFAHKGHDHHSGHVVQPSVEREKPVFVKIAVLYHDQIEPVVQAKCMQCHGGTPRHPWYYSVPGVKQLIDRDVAVGKEHLDFSRGFPFASHATPPEDIQAMKEVAEENSMPPFLYGLAHANDRLNENDRKRISEWATQSLAIMKSSESRN